MSLIEGQYIPEPTLNVGDVITLRVNEKGELITASSGGGGGGGDASAANQVTEIAKLTSIDGKTPALGQALAAGSVPIVLTAIQLSALTPPAAITGFATSAKQDTAQTSLGSIDSNINTIRGSVSTASKQDTGNTSLASIDSKTPAIGTAEMVGSTPVTIATDDQVASDISTSKSLLDAILSGQANLTNQASITNDVSNILSRTPIQPDQFRNVGANATLNISNFAGSLYSARCRNLNIAARYIQFWNTATTAGTGTLLEEFMIPGSSELIIGTDYFTALGLPYDTGLAFGFSTTSGTYTAGTAADQITFVRYH